MLIAKIIKSNSHVDYSARILDSMETATPPGGEDYQFGQFVRVSIGEADVIGIIYNSELINPEYGNYGPRLSTPNELNAVFSPDYLNEQGVMIGVLLLGWTDGQGSHQQVPRVVLPINSHIETLTDDEVRAFHHDSGGALHLSYYPLITAHAGAFSYPLLEAIVDQIERLTTERERMRLDVLRRAMAWQQTMGGLM
ncbi:MAG: hypothetical protein IPM66_19870 [Acidobacteriota bacterium]|nr:MAG: hypothetical protein IPM66_19870 [Acidobacteriota bacterium]